MGLFKDFYLNEVKKDGSWDEKDKINHAKSELMYSLIKKLGLKSIGNLEFKNAKGEIYHWNDKYDRFDLYQNKK